jgi:hypothetical protein
LRNASKAGGGLSEPIACDDLVTRGHGEEQGEE